MARMTKYYPCPRCGKRGVYRDAPSRFAKVQHMLVCRYCDWLEGTYGKLPAQGDDLSEYLNNQPEKRDVR